MPYDTSNQASGVLFTNTKKTNTKAPDYSGNIEISADFLRVIQANMVNGVCKLDLAGWRREGRNGTFLSLNAKPPFSKDGNTGAPRRVENSSDIPF